jgi:hypothetical protein
MKKQYNITHLTDELSNSVFFQKPEQPVAPEEKQQSPVAPKYQVSKAPALQSAKALHNQPTEVLKQENTKAPSKHPEKAVKQQSTGALKHFSSYLQPRTYKAWKLLATEREKKDYEILQEAVEQYLAREQARE